MSEEVKDFGDVLLRDLSDLGCWDADIMYSMNGKHIQVSSQPILFKNEVAAIDDVINLHTAGSAGIDCSVVRVEGFNGFYTMRLRIVACFDCDCSSRVELFDLAVVLAARIRTFVSSCRILKQAAEIKKDNVKVFGFEVG